MNYLDQIDYYSEKFSRERAIADGVAQQYTVPPRIITLTLSAHALIELAIIMADAEGVTFDNQALISLLKNDDFRKAFNDRVKQTS